jgi:hypothetical protein
MSEPLDNLASRAVRLKGLLKALGGLAALCLLWRFGVMELLEKLLDKRGDARLTGYALLAALCAPVVLFFIGAVEAVAGTRFRRIASAWNQMSEWRQGLMALLLLSLAIAVVVSLLWLAGL